MIRLLLGPRLRGTRRRPAGPLQSRAERVIAAGRVMLATLSLLAITLDPPQPVKYAQAVYTLLAVFAGYALLMAVLVWRSQAVVARLRLMTHALDLAVWALFMHFTEGHIQINTGFVFFVFCLLCAALRWRWYTTLWTGGVGVGVYTVGILGDPSAELNRLVARSVYLAAVTILLGLTGAYVQQVMRGMRKLAAWPRSIPREIRALEREVLENAADLLGAPRAVMVWEEREEPWVHVGSWSRGEFHRTREAPATFEPLVAEPLAGSDFLCQDARAPLPTVLRRSSDGLERWHGSPIHPGLQARYDMGAVLSVRLSGECVEGRLFFLDKPGMTSDDLVLGEIVARRVVGRMDHFYLLERLKQAAAAEERLRLARDLHDGLLQSLTGAALQLQTVHRLLEADPRAAGERLLRIQRQIAAEQRDLRAFIRNLKAMPIGLPAADSSLAARLEELTNRLEQQWGLRFELRMADRLEGRIPEALEHEVYRIVQEAFVNAARHAGARTVRVELSAQDNHARITVVDDGHGFPFRGHYDHAALTEMNLGPVALKERVASCGGSLAIDSTEAGARLEITLPRDPPGARDAR